MSRGETEAHRELKRLAVAWARAAGWAIVTTEVRVPRSGYRADVAAVGRGAGRSEGGKPEDRRLEGGGSEDRRERLGGVSGGGVAGRSAIFECKQARGDWRKDAFDDAGVEVTLAAALKRRTGLEALLAVHRPDLRRGEALWPEYDAWDFGGLEHAGYRTVVEEIERWQTRRRGGTKFAKLRRWRSADFLYLVVEEGIYAEAEVPAGWGLLVRRGEELELMRKPWALDAGVEQRRALLEAIAVAATRREK